MGILMPGSPAETPGSSSYWVKSSLSFSNGNCVEVAEFIVWSHDRRQARLHPDPYAGLADNQLSPLELEDVGRRSP